jgi:hypothetical protein
LTKYRTVIHNILSFLIEYLEFTNIAIGVHFMSFSEERRLQLINLLKDAYDLRPEIERRLRVVINDPVQQDKLKLDLQRLVDEIAHFEAQLEGTAVLVSSAPPKAGSEVEKLKADLRGGQNRHLRVFLCHSRKDKDVVHQLYSRLYAAGVRPWLDEESLLPGQDWQIEIPKAVRTSDIVLVFLSCYSTTQAGYVQKEIKFALDVADQQPEGAIFLIPVRLEECEVPERLRQLQWVNYFDERGYERLLSALKHRSSELGLCQVEDNSLSSMSSVIGTSSLLSTQLVESLNQLSWAKQSSELDFSSIIDPASQGPFISDNFLAALNSTDPTTRQQAAAQYLNDRLQNLFGLDPRYITCAEYQLFIDAGRQNQVYYQPDHWQGFTFPTNGALAPITGVRVEDVQAFCEWLNQCTGTNRFRLPYPREVESVTNPFQNLAFWCRQGGTDNKFNLHRNFSLTNLTDQSELLNQIGLLTETDMPRPLSLDFYHTLAHNPDNPLVLALDLAFDRTLNSSGVFGLNLLANPNFYCDFDPANIRDLDLALFRTLNLSYGAFDGISALSTSVFDRTHPLPISAFSCSSALDSDFTIGCAHDLAYACAAIPLRKSMSYLIRAGKDSLKENRIRADRFGEIVSALESEPPNLFKARTLAWDLKESGDNYAIYPATLLVDLLDAALALSDTQDTALALALSDTQFFGWRQAYRRYASHLAECAYIGYSKLGEEKYAKEMQLMADLYWWMQVVIAREEGRLDAWEGIRIVAE